MFMYMDAFIVYNVSSKFCLCTLARQNRKKHRMGYWNENTFNVLQIH